MTQPLLLIGGPLELDDTEIPDIAGTVVTVQNAKDGAKHLYYVMRDWKQNRWVGKWQRRIE